jgi:hypothetical protein
VGRARFITAKRFARSPCSFALLSYDGGVHALRNLFRSSPGPDQGPSSGPVSSHWDRPDVFHCLSRKHARIRMFSTCRPNAPHRIHPDVFQGDRPDVLQGPPGCFPSVCPDVFHPARPDLHTARTRMFSKVPARMLSIWRPDVLHPPRPMSHRGTGCSPSRRPGCLPSLAYECSSPHVATASTATATTFCTRAKAHRALRTCSWAFLHRATARTKPRADPHR